LSETVFLLPAEDGDVADAARRMADTPQRGYRLTSPRFPFGQFGSRGGQVFG
jgi:hypothetical protein